MTDTTTSSCSKRWFMCLQDPRCEDLGCPAHPGLVCSSCQGSTCTTPMDCQLPEPQPPRPKTFRTNLGIDGPFFPKTREGWGRLVGGLLGLAGAAFITGAVLRHLQLI